MPKPTEQKSIFSLINASTDTIRHPLTKQPYRCNPAIYGKCLGEINHPEQMPAFYEGSNWSDGSRIVAYLDGHIEELNAAAWARLQAKWKLP